MRILLIGPDHPSGSLSPYVAQLAAALRSEGATVDRLRSPSLPYDTEARRFLPIERIIEMAHDMLGQVDLTAYDLVSIHFGNLELEQLLPVGWAERPHAPAVYHAHTIAPTLLTDHVPAEHLHRRVLEAIRSMDGLVYFGHHARRQLADQHHGIPAEVTWWPTTIPARTEPHPFAALRAALERPDGVPLVSVYGFASPWKNAATLIQAARGLNHPARIVLAGPFWDDPSQAGVVLREGFTRLNQHVDLAVVPTYVPAPARLALLRASDLGVFPYQDHPSFQGSGAISDYLGHGVPVIATDVASLAEVVGDGGVVVHPNDTDALLDTLNTLIGTPGSLTELRATAHRRRHLFSMPTHAQRCLTFYRKIRAHERRQAVSR